VAAKLDQRTAFVAGDGARMRLEEAEYLLPQGHLLALQHARARLGNDALHQRQHVVCLGHEPPGLLPRLLTQRRDHPLLLMHHLLGRLN
jgi:hypothetical protein